MLVMVGELVLNYFYNKGVNSLTIIEKERMFIIKALKMEFR